MRRALMCIALFAAVLLTGCGDSAEEKAQNTVCDARSDISAQVDDLRAIIESGTPIDSGCLADPDVPLGDLVL